MATHPPNEDKEGPSLGSWLDQLVDSDAKDSTSSLKAPAKDPIGLDRTQKKQGDDTAIKSVVSPETTTSKPSGWMNNPLLWISIIASVETIFILSGGFGSRSSSAITRLPATNAVEALTSSLREKEFEEDRSTLVVSASGETPYITIMSAVAAAKEGALIRVKPGSYRESLVLDKSLTIQGDGKSEDIRIESSSGTVLAIEAPQVVVRGLTIARLAGTGERALQAVEIRSGEATLDDCDVSSATGNGIDVIGVDATFMLTRCRLHDTIAAGVWLKAGASCEVFDCDFEKIGATCIVAQKDSRSLVRKSRFSDSKIGIYVNKADSHIVECSFSIFAASAVQCDEKAKVSVHSCEISKCTDSLLAVNESTLSITSCKILDSQASAINGDSKSRLQISDTEIRRCSTAINSTDSDVVCCRILVHDCRTSGLSLLKNSSLLLLDSEFRDCSIGFNLNGISQLTALRCNVAESGDHGIALNDNASLIMHKCDIGSAKKAIIFCTDKSTINLSSSKIHGGVTQAIVGSNESRSHLVDCDLFENGEQQILLRQQHRMFIQGGTIYSTKKVGVMALESVALSIRDCKIEDCEQLGVRLLSDQMAQLVNVEFKKNGVAVYVDKSGKAELISCKSVESIHHDWHAVEGGELIGKNNSPDLSEARIQKGSN